METQHWAIEVRPLRCWRGGESVAVAAAQSGLHWQKPRLSQSLWAQE